MNMRGDVLRTARKEIQENRFESLFQRQNEVILLRKTFENALIIHVQQNHF